MFKVFKDIYSSIKTAGAELLPSCCPVPIDL